MIIKLKKMIVFMLNLPRYIKILNSIKNKEEKRIFVLGIPEHGNLGDQAIAYAQNEFIKKNTEGVKLIELPYLLCENMTNSLINKINNQDILCLMGGGSMGSLWKDVEIYYRKIIKTFPNNKIIIFPHTIYYSEKELKREFFLDSINIYNSHNNLFINAREKRSFDFFNKYYPNANILLAPDIVLTLEKNNNYMRENILLCLRKDKESDINNSFSDIIKTSIINSKNSYKVTDTVIEDIVNINNRESKLEEKWDEFSKSKLVITDRLHGMIFAIITGTPCIAFDNKSKKVSGVFDIVSKYVNNVEMVNSLNEFDNSFKRLVKIGNLNYNNKLILPMYDELLEVIKR